MAQGTSGDSSRGVPGFILRGIQDSFTTQGLAEKQPRRCPNLLEECCRFPGATRDRLKR
jgi:hypothetical protein